MAGFSSSQTVNVYQAGSTAKSRLLFVDFHPNKPIGTNADGDGNAWLSKHERTVYREHIRLYLLVQNVGNGWVAGGCWDDYILLVVIIQIIPENSLRLAPGSIAEIYGHP